MRILRRGGTWGSCVSGSKLGVLGLVSVGEVGRTGMWPEHTWACVCVDGAVPLAAKSSEVACAESLSTSLRRVAGHVVRSVLRRERHSRAAVDTPAYVGVM